MKFVFIILFFPFFAWGFMFGVPFKKSEVCVKIRTDIIKNWKRDEENQKKEGGDFSFGAVSEMFADLSSGLKKTEKYKCFKQTPACRESIKDTIKSLDAVSSSYSEETLGAVFVSAILSEEMGKATMEGVNSGVDRNLKKLDSSYENVKKYCK